MNNLAGTRIRENKEQFIKMWNDNISSSEMGYHFNCNNSTINIYAKQFGLERRNISGDYKKHFEEISQDELERRCKAVQATWDEQTEYSRRVQKDIPLTVRHILSRKDHFVDNGACQPIEMISLDEFSKQLDRAGHRQPATRAFNE